MIGWLIYGKRTGLTGKGHKPVFDKTFRALDSVGRRVTTLTNAMCYATKEDAQAILDKPVNKKLIEDGLVLFEIRKAR